MQMMCHANNLERDLVAAVRERDNAISDKKQADTDTIRALHERNEAREQLEREIDEARKEADEWKTKAKSWRKSKGAYHDLYKLMREQRDRLAQALREILERNDYGSSDIAQHALKELKGDPEI